MQRLQLLTEVEATKVNRRLDRLRDDAHTSMVGGRYMRGVPKLRSIERLVAQARFWSMSAEFLRCHPAHLAFLSLSALDVLPGDPGLGEHVDYPHHALPDSPHLCSQFILSLDGTDKERAPLWVDEPDNLVCMQPGELLFFGGNTRHGVHPNKSDRPRTTLLWSMGLYWIRPMLRELWSWNLRERFAS